jgi:hypothetical protein
VALDRTLSAAKKESHAVDLLVGMVGKVGTFC